MSAVLLISCSTFSFIFRISLNFNRFYSIFGDFSQEIFRPRVSLNKKHVTVRLFEEIYGQLGTGRGTKCSK